MRTKDLFFEFSNEDRNIIFRTLSDREKKHSEIEQETGIHGSEISRHLKRLMDKNLINKTPDNKYCISNIGKIFVRILDLFEVSIKHKEYFNFHDITDIPLYLLMQLGNLKTIETSNKTLQNIELWSNLVKNTEKFIYAISDQFQNSLLPIVEKKIQDQSIDVRALIDRKLAKLYKIPEEWKRFFQNPETFFKNLKVYENIRLLKEINFSLVVTDKGAILFLSRDGEIDYSQCLIDNHESFINWTTDLFEWYWKSGENLKPFIKEAQKLK